MSTTMLKRDLGTGDLCDNIGLVGVSAKWSYVTASPSHYDQAIPILSPLLFMHVGHPYIPLFFDLLVFLCLYQVCDHLSTTIIPCRAIISSECIPTYCNSCLHMTRPSAGCQQCTDSTD